MKRLLIIIFIIFKRGGSELTREKSKANKLVIMLELAKQTLNVVNIDFKTYTRFENAFNLLKSSCPRN